MPNLPQEQNQNGWQLPKNIVLRNGQQQAIKSIETNPKQTKFLFVLPTGYGKSFVTLLSYQVARMQGRCNRLLIVVANNVQKEQYARDIASDARTLNIHLIGDTYKTRECDGGSFVVNSHRKNQCEVFITNVQKIKSDPGFYSDLMEKGLWMVVADEAHHYSSENSWGQSVMNLSPAICVGMTATPQRSDKNELAVGGLGDYDVYISVKDALKEGAIRPFRVERGDYHVDLSIGGVVRSMKLSEIMEEMREMGIKNISEWEIQRQCRYHSKYIQGIFCKALSVFYHLDLFYPQQNQILVFAWSCDHAKQVSAQINQLTGDPNFSDWMGTNGRSDEENALVFERFMAKENFMPCLVQVNMASEGFNNPRCSIGIFLNAVGVDTPTLGQQLGRFLRAKKETSPNAVLFVGADHPLASADLSGLGEMSYADSKCDPSYDDYIDSSEILDRYHIRIPSLDDIFIDVKQVAGWDTAYPFGQPVEALADLAIQTGKYNPGDKEQLIKTLLEIKEQSRPEQFISKETHSKHRDKLRAQNTSAVRQLVLSALEQTIFPQKISGSIQGDWFKKTNGYLANKFGPINSLDIDELKSRYAFIEDVTKQINKLQEVPAWMIP